MLVINFHLKSTSRAAVSVEEQGFRLSAGLMEDSWMCLILSLGNHMEIVC